MRDLEAQNKELMGIKQRVDAWQKDPNVAFRELGGDVRSLAETVVRGKPSAESEVVRLEKDLAEIRQQMGQLATERKTEQQSRYFNDYADQINDIRTKDVETYQDLSDAMEILGDLGTPVDLATAIQPHIERQFAETNRVLTPAEAAATLRTGRRAAGRGARRNTARDTHSGRSHHSFAGSGRRITAGRQVKDDLRGAHEAP
jgi:predicted  nucleic acid-binding Zn-ribbon protein